MYDLYLKAPSEEALKADLPWAVCADGTWLAGTHQWALDPIGILVKQPAHYDPVAGGISNAVYYDGWHANIRIIDDAILDLIMPDLLIDVATPMRTWAK